MCQVTPVDGFRLGYDRAGRGPAVVLLHGWPGDRTDYREVAPLAAAAAEVITPDLRGFGESDKHEAYPATQYSAAAQARSVAALIVELGLTRPVIAGYDIGSRIAQTLAAERPDLVRSLAAGHLEHLVSAYAPEGAFTASINWYRAGAGSMARSLAEQPPAPADRLTVPTTVLWPSHDPLFPPSWSDRIGEFFADTRLIRLPGAGHFTPLERPGEFAAAIISAC
jgi:pimeloyl-ACP methyl ester carboxylesterase